MFLSTFPIVLNNHKLPHYIFNPFKVFDIVGPQAQSSGNLYGGAIGDCTTDSFSISTKGYTGTPVICGINTGQHSN